MRVVFAALSAKEPLAYGLMSLAASLRRHGHEVSLVHGRTAAEVSRAREVRDADVLALSATTGLHRVYVSWARQLRARFPDKALVMGGPHCTYFPQVLESAPLDGICIGEGEESFPEFLDALGDELRCVPDGWWVRRDRGRGPVVRGLPRGPVRDLDRLPAPAFDLYYDAHRRYRSLPIRIFLATRGCPHRCSYCFNRTQNLHNKPFGPLLRAHDPEVLCDQILSVHRRWGGRMVWFLDANFAANRRWVEAFARVYRAKVGMPFFCKLRPERATAEVVRTLVDAGCTGVGIGIESGSERLRRHVLGRPGSDSEILEGCRQLKRHGIRVMSFTMLGIPTESLDDALRSVALNVACGVDYAGATVLQPYPGTEIARWAVERGYFDGNFDRLSYSYFSESPLRFPSARDRDRITNLQRLFAFAVEFPEVRARLHWLIDREPVGFYRSLFEARHSWAMHHTLYRGFERLDPVDAGTAQHLLSACAELGVTPEVRMTRGGGRPRVAPTDPPSSAA